MATTRKRPYYDEPYSDYDPTIDYQARINENVAAGDFEQAAINEAYRRSKIEGEGLDYEPTHLYDKYLNPTGYGQPNQYGAQSGQYYNGFASTPAPGAHDYEAILNQAKELTAALQGRAPFSYDPNTDPMYAIYRDMYTNNGERAMQDTLGQVSARTGGLASSYAAGAAQQAYNNYMDQLNARVPELAQLAYSMYVDEGNRQRQSINDLYSLLGAYQGVDQDAYNRWYNDRNFAYGTWQDDLANEWRQREWDYNTGNDAKTEAQDFITNWLTYGGDPAQLTDEELEAAGWTRDYAELMSTYIKQQLALKARGSGGGGRGGSDEDGAGWTTEDAVNALFEDAYASGLDPNVFISNNYKQYGLTGVSDLKKAYATWLEGMPQRNFEAQAAALGEITGGYPVSNRYSPEEVAAADTGSMDTMNMAYLFFNDNFAGQKQFTSTMEKAAEDWARAQGMTGNAREGQIAEFIDYIRYWIEEG